MSLFPQAPKPASALGYYRLLSPTAGVRVSPLCLGAMSFGDAWKGILGECDKEQSFAILDYYYDNGGNFIDVANNYQNGESEKWVGEWLQKRQNRNEIVLSTKYTTGFGVSGAKIKSNYQGNHAKCLRHSLEASLSALQTDYIDLFYLHWWDFSTSVPEVMRSLHQLVVSGKVLYLGASNVPAWIIVKCNEYARYHGLTPFSVYSGRWSAACRDIERDLLPMCVSEGMAISPWGVLSRGQFREEGKAGEAARKPGPLTDDHQRVNDKLAEIATRKGTVPTSVALAYLLQKAPYVFPVVGGRKIEHLQSNIEALTLHLSDEDMQEIESAAPFDYGQPLAHIFSGQYKTHAASSDIPMLQATTRLQSTPPVQCIDSGQVAGIMA